MSGRTTSNSEWLRRQVAAEDGGFVSTGGLVSRMDRMTFVHFSQANRARCESANGFNHHLDSWSTSDWMTAILGELGEAANVAKKLNRYRDNIPGNRETVEQLRGKLKKELGDTFVYLDLICQSLGFSVGEAAVEVFNDKSREIGYPVVLPTPASEPEPEGER